MFEIIKPLGSGKIGDVFLCTVKGEKVAVKIYRNKGVEIEKALELAKSIKHPNLMKSFNYFYENGNLLSIIEYIDGKNLDETDISKMGDYLPQIVSALKYLHINKIVHLDIKPQNILVDKNDRIKIVDYDFLKNTENSFFVHKGFIGTPFYMSPELYEQKNYTCRTDLWSLGVTLYYCFAKEVPFNANNKRELKILLQSNYIPNYDLIPLEYRQIVSGLLIKDYEKRLSLNDILLLLKR